MVMTNSASVAACAGVAAAQRRSSPAPERLRVHVKDVKLVTLFQQILRHWRAHLP
jgi:hypothetical protein